jgi:spermidine synthase
MAASGVAVAAVLGLMSVPRGEADNARPEGRAYIKGSLAAPTEPAVTDSMPKRSGKRSRQRRPDPAKSDAPPRVPSPAWLAASVLGLSGFASLMFEIAWTRVLAMTIGPTIYAFAATLAALIAGLAIGSGVGAWMAGRTRSPAGWLAFALAASAVAAAWTTSLAGGEVPRLVAEQFARAPEQFDEMLSRGVLLVAALIVPTAVGLGAAFPLALATLGGTPQSAASRFGMVYAVNTLGAVAGSLAAGFLAIPFLGLQQTMRLVSALLIVASVIVVLWGRLSIGARAVNLAAVAGGVWLVASSPSWDRQLLASGTYMYAPYVPKDLDLLTQLKAGTLLYYREGAASTVSVKRLTGTLSLAIDGKTDASNRSDMLTQKLIAHLPLLLHENPKDVFIIGLGSGVTLGSALRHPIARADVVEISREVVEASRQFAKENRNALDDPRSHLIVGDGRSHLQLSTRQYDVIISEPSNPWIAGVAALFTREFFVTARERLAPGGIMCQWANIYNISDRDLRSIAATFTSVFPDGTVWLIGENDALFVASTTALDARLANIERRWNLPEVIDDLRDVAAVEPFALWSLFAGGPEELKGYGADAPILTDDRMTLEFSAPRNVHSNAARGNAATLGALLDGRGGPLVIQRAHAAAGAAEWSHRGAMMFKSDFHATAYDDYARALTLDPTDAGALDGFAQASIMTRRTAGALERLKSLTSSRAQTPAILVAKSKLLAASGSFEAALAAATEASSVTPVQAVALEQLASLVADASDTIELDTVVETLRRAPGGGAAAHYYAAVSRFLRNDFAGTVRLAQDAIAADPQYAPVYDLVGAAHTKLGQTDAAREAFHTSLGFDAHDSTAYTNLGLLELSSGSAAAAAGYFAEALWLEPESATARQGLARARGR